MKINAITAKSFAALGAVFIACAPAAGEVHSFHFLSAADVQPASILPAPSAKGSPAEKAELATLHALIGEAPAARMAQAKWDDVHEDPALFDAALGVKLETLPKTWALLKAVQNEGDAAADLSKVYFHRTRPWGVDPSISRCDNEPNAKPTGSYPSGHSTLGYSTGFVLARLLPGRADVVLARSADYAMSRQVCGVHFPSDTEASHVLGTYVATRLMADPAFVRQFDAARAELKAAHVAGA